MKVCIIQTGLNVLSETFIKAHIDGLSADVVHGSGQPLISGSPVLSQSLASRALRKIRRKFSRLPWDYETTAGYIAAFRRFDTDVVLAEYGMTGVRVLEAVQRIGLPLVVHFHGYDASRYDILDKFAVPYQEMFAQAAAVIAVSRAMEQKLLSIGCPQEKLVYNPYGIDCRRFVGAAPEMADARFLSVGRFVEKKAPHLTLLALKRALQEEPNLRLRMIGGGELLGVCKDLAVALGIEHAVDFLGPQRHEVIQEEMRVSRAFVQHSVVAESGDSEGTPVAVLEAGAAGLPVISTRHAGIPDVVIEGETGLLVDERDVDAMAEHMLTLARDPQLAGELGRAAADHVRKYYTMEQSIGRLQRVLVAAIEGHELAATRAEIEAEFPKPELEPAN